MKFNYNNYTTKKLVEIFCYCPDRKITDVVEKILGERGIDLGDIETNNSILYDDDLEIDLQDIETINYIYNN